jgi:flagellar hook-basal body complex protein FliE
MSDHTIQGVQGASFLPADISEKNTLQSSRVDFGGLLKGLIDRVNDQQQDSDTMTKAYQLGTERDLAQVMLASQKADIAFNAMTQMRNRLVDAYQEIMRMPI